MTQFTIINTATAVVIGTYEAETEALALDAMARDAGYPDYAAACDVAPIGDDEIVVLVAAQ